MLQEISAPNRINWKIDLQQLEDSKQWDAAIELLQTALKQNPDDKDAYLRMLYLLMNLLVEEDFDDSKCDHYEQLAKQYFHESYNKFNNDADFLFYAGSIGFISVWYFGIETETVEAMIEKAKQLNPHNPAYNWLSLSFDFRKNPDIVIPEATKAYARSVFEKDSPIRKELEPRGSLGHYFLERMEYMSEKIFEHLTRQQQKDEADRKIQQETK